MNKFGLENTNVPGFIQSPALAWFGHLVEEDGLVGAQDVKINWNSIGLGEGEVRIPVGSRVKDVAVLFYPKRLITDYGHPLRKAADYCDDKYFYYTHGNVFNDWGDHSDLETATWRIWDDLCYFGFLNDDEAKRARMQFARIRECAWARDSNFEMPKGTPWTDEDHASLEDARKRDKEWEAEELEREKNPPPPPVIVHTDAWNYQFQNEEKAIAYLNKSIQKNKDRLAQLERGEIVIDRDNPESHRPVPAFEASMWDDEKILKQIKAWCSGGIDNNNDILAKIEAGDVNTGEKNITMILGDWS